MWGAGGIRSAMSRASLPVGKPTHHRGCWLVLTCLLLLADLLAACECRPFACVGQWRAAYTWLAVDGPR